LTERDRDEDRPEEEATPEEEELAEDLFLSPDDEDGEVVDLGGGEEPVDESAEIDHAEEADGDVEEEDGEEVVEAKIGELQDVLEQKDGELEELRETVGELEKEKEEINDRLLRVAADLENFRRRTEREKEEIKKFGIDRVISELLPAVDNMERALQHADDRGDESSLVEGIEMVHRQILAALKKHGVEGFSSHGESFDPTRHEAIQQVETTDHPTGTVIDEYQKGYFLHDRLLRPALVSVAKRVEPPENEAGESALHNDSDESDGLGYSEATEPQDFSGSRDQDQDGPFEGDDLQEG
jgi:molecular chaperone GrpE